MCFAMRKSLFLDQKSADFLVHPDLLEGHAAFTREDALRAERFPGSWSRMFIENIFLKYWWITFEDSRGVNLAIKNSVPVPVKTLEIRQSI